MLDIFCHRCGRPWETHHPALSYNRNDSWLYDQDTSGPKVSGIQKGNPRYVVSTVAPVSKSSSIVRKVLKCHGWYNEFVVFATQRENK